MNRKNLLLSTLAIMLLTPMAFAAHHQPSITAVSLAEDVIDRQPSGTIFNKELSCNDAAQAPSINAGEYPIVYLWTRVKNSEPRIVNHVWEHFSNDAWEVVAEVPLKVGKSAGWRTWSSKNLSTSSRGSWRVFIIPEDMPDTVLCSVYFNVT